MPAFKDGSVIAFINYGAGTCLDLTASQSIPFLIAFITLEAS